MGIFDSLLPVTTKQTLYLRYFGLRKIPLLYYVRPSIVTCTEEQVAVRLPDDVITARLLVGVDGARSAVRELIGAELIGQSVDEPK